MAKHTRMGGLVRLGAAAALLLLGFGTAMPAMAQDVTSTKPVTSSMLFSLPPGTIFTVSPGPCMPAADMVTLAGDVHIVTLVRQGMLTEVHLNMAGFQGVGQTGNLYIGTGSQKVSYPGGVPLVDLPAVKANFTLEHTDGCASDPLPINAVLSFGPAGELLSRTFISGGWDENGPALNGLVSDAALPEDGLRALAVELPEAR